MTTKRKKSDAIRFLENIIGGPLTFGGLMLSIREGEEWTMAEMAEKLGVSRGFISNIEKGKAVRPEAAAKYARILGYGEQQFVRLALQDHIRRSGLDYEVRLERTSGHRKAG